MGIRPNGDGASPPVTPDNPETRYSDWLTDLEDSGEIVGGVWQETDAKASSGNDGVTDLAGRVSTLEGNTPAPRTRISGTGWRALHYNGVVEVSLIGAEVGWTLPEGWRPPYMKYAPVVDLLGKSPTARVSVNPNGLVTLLDTTGACYGSLVYLL